MGRKALHDREKRAANLALRVLASLCDDIETAILGRNCNKSEFISTVLTAALANALAAQAIAEVENSKVRRLEMFTRIEVMKPLDAVEKERTLLRCALEEMPPR
ncbi:MAG: hypothetical protein JF606_29465 [Burkholderiales bacterium]|nr:hypothetical protein [Burkholderiales bacterium]